MDSHRQPQSQGIIHLLRQRELGGRRLEQTENPWTTANVPVPSRFRLQMESILPRHALENGHIFLGFTTCGQYLLSYTYKVMSGENGSPDEFQDQDYFYQYKLYFWLFVPHRKLRKTRSLVLFQEETGVPDNNLIIQLLDYGTGELIITGRSASPESGSNALLYLTVTAVPSASSNFAFHSIVYRCYPFPNLIPGLQFLTPRTLVLNSGNAFHVLTFKPNTTLEPPPLKPRHRLQISFWIKNEDPEGVQTLLDQQNNNLDRLRQISSQALQRNQDCILYQEKFLALVPSPMCLLSIAEETQSQKKKNRRRPSSICSYDSEFSQVSSSLQSDCSMDDSVPPSCQKPIPTPTTDPSPPTKTERKFFKSMSWRRSRSSEITTPETVPPSDCYEQFDEENTVQDSLSSFRKRQNAEKLYHFTDSNEENNLPRFQMNRTNRLRRASPRRTLEEEPGPGPPLRPLNVNMELELELLNSPRELNQSCPPSLSPPVPDTWAQRPTFTKSTMGTCIIKGRKIGSVPMVDDDYNMNMYGLNVEIPDSNPSLHVELTTLDLELFCHEVMELLCFATGFSYSSYSDYDVAQLWVDEKSGAVTGLACVLAQAEDLKNPSGGPDPRRTYEVTFSFVWEPETNNCRLLYLGNLKEIGSFREPWNPTKSIQIHLLHQIFPDAANSISAEIPQSNPTFPRVLTNEKAVLEWKSWKEMSDGHGLWNIHE